MAPESDLVLLGEVTRIKGNAVDLVHNDPGAQARALGKAAISNRGDGRGPHFVRFQDDPHPGRWRGLADRVGVRVLHRRHRCRREGRPEGRNKGRPDGLKAPAF